MIANNMCPRKADVARLTINLARLYHDHQKFDDASENYRKAVELYQADPLARSLDEILPWVTAQIENCKKLVGSDPPPVVRTRQEAASS
jgi:hypothetical protein